MKREKIYIVRLRGLLPAALLAAALMIGACDFQLLESPEMPRWGVSLTIPLINKNYPFTDVADSSVIFEDTSSHELQIEFRGDLDTTSIDSSYLEIILPASATPDPINEVITSPDGASLFSAVAETVQVTIALDSILAATGQPLYAGISFPDSIAVPVPDSVWNNFVANAAIDQIVGPFVLLDTTTLKQDYDFIKSFSYVQLDTSAVNNEFSSTVENKQFPTTVDSIRLQVLSDPLNVVHDTTSLDSGQTFFRATSLASEKLGAEVSMGIRMFLPQVTEDVVIAAFTDPEILFTIILKVGGVDSLAIRTAEVSLIPGTPDPLPLPGDIEIVRGVLRSGVDSPINEISLSNLSNTLPFDINFQLTFPNFASDITGTDSLIMGPWVLVDGQAPIDTTASLEGYMFHNPASGGAIDAFEYLLTANLTEKDIVLPLDGSALGAFQASFSIGDLYFDEITGNFAIEFPTVPTTIDKIPTGFTGFLFDRLALELHLYNQIALPVILSLDLQGLNARGDTVSLPILAPLNYPGAESWSGDTAYTVVRLDETAVSTYWLPAGETDIAFAMDSTIVSNQGQSIVDVMNMPPDTLKVGGSAIIQGEGSVVAGASVWGEFELIAPFAFILPHAITFLPADATPVEPMDSSTRVQIQTALLSASLTTKVTSDFPIGGNINMLISDSTLFPLAYDELDKLAAGIPETVYTNYDTTIYTNLQDALAADSIMGISHIVFYPETTIPGQSTVRSGIRATRIEFFTTSTDTAPAFWVGRMFDMEIPPPAEVDSKGYVITPGDTTQVIALDAERVAWLASDKTVYLKPLISFYATSGARTIQSTNSIDFLAYMTFELASDVLVVPEEVDTNNVTTSSVPTDSVAVDSTISIDLDGVFNHPDVTITAKDMELEAYSNHTGVAVVDIAPDTTDRNKRLLLITGVGVGAAKITVTADDDPLDDADPMEVSLYVTVYEDTSGAPASARWLDHKSEQRKDETKRRPPSKTGKRWQ